MFGVETFINRRGGIYARRIPSRFIIWKDRAGQSFYVLLVIFKVVCKYYFELIRCAT